MRQSPPHFMSAFPPVLTVALLSLSWCGRYFLGYIRLCAKLCTGRNAESLAVVQQIIPRDAAMALFDQFKNEEFEELVRHAELS